jgi:hypothetical protein
MAATSTPLLSRRDSLKCLGAATLALGGPRISFGEDAPVKPKNVAAVITAYERGLHADVLLGKILEGWKYDNGPKPALKLVSMYVDQFSPRDMARPMAAKHGVMIAENIEQALTLGRNEIAVDGVISIGEHGDYPWNDRGQHLYPRRRFFAGIADAFEKHGRVVPVFNDKHLGPVWSDAKWMYDRARELKIPFMAGSSLPNSYRQPEITVPMNGDIEAALAIGYSGLDIYASHTLECLQSFVERRRGAEQGVKWVQAVQGDAIWKAVDDGVVAKDVLEATLAVTPHGKPEDLRKTADAILFLFEYVDGFQGAVLMLPGYASAISAGVRLKGKPPIACRFEERPEPHHPHFAYLLKGIERMIHKGQSPYPVERTLLTSGILDRGLTSLAEKNRRIETPELMIAYQPVDYPHAPQPELTADPTTSLR